MAASEGGGDRPPQAGVRRRFVLQQRVPVQQVERYELFHRGRVGPDPAEPAMPQHRRSGAVRYGDRQPEPIVPVHLTGRAQPRELRIRIGEELGIARVEHRPSLARWRYGN